MKPNALLFGTAGIPLCSKGPTEKGIAEVKRLGLGAMELEFVHSINISKEKAPLVRKASEDNGIVLTCHAPYYINLNSNDTEKFNASKDRILKSAHILNLCGGWSLCFHPGFYQVSTKEDAYSKVSSAIKEMAKSLEKEKNGVWLRPETTGKETQFGSLSEILKISSECENVMPCIDFAHLHARSNGKYNSKKEFASILEDVERTLGKRGLQNMHIHLTGIEYGEKGEKKHLNLEESDLKFEELLSVLKDFNAKGVVISESPNVEKDAILAQKIYAGL